MPVHVRKGEWAGQGRYLLLEYSQPCPRGCCRDDVREVLASEEVIREASEVIRNLGVLIREARGKCAVQVALDRCQGL
jgi:hypothetical protein